MLIDGRGERWREYNHPEPEFNPGEISDMMRYEILHRYGGVYLDFDCECLQSLESLHYLYDFYIGIQPLDSGLVQLGIGIIGAIPGHPIIKQCIDHIKDHWGDKKYEWMATARTGPIYCTKIFYQFSSASNTIDIALPASYFYPLGSTEFTLKKKEWLQQGSFAVHHWAGSWILKEEAFVPGIKIRSKVTDNTIRFTIVDER